MSNQKAGRLIQSGSELQWVALGKIHCRPEGEGQRAFRPSHPIFQEPFDPDKFQRPTLNRLGAQFWVVDGHHRIVRYRQELKPEEQETQQIECWVYSNLTLAQEADKFLALNNVLTVDAFGKFKNAVTARHIDQTRVAEIVQSLGFAIQRGSGDNTLQCVTTALKVYRRNADSLPRALGIIAEAFGTRGVDRQLLDGLGMLVDRYNGALKDELAVAQLHALRGGSTALLQRAQALRKSTGAPIAQCVAAAATEVINRKAGTKKLPGWWKDR